MSAALVDASISPQRDVTRSGSDLIGLLAMSKKQGHRVYLSDFSLRQFQALKALTGTSPYCFPARNHEKDTHIDVKTVSKQVGDRQIQFKVRKDLSRRANDNALVLKNGSHREWTPHDMRRTVATMMQALGVLPHIIDRCRTT